MTGMNSEFEYGRGDVLSFQISEGPQRQIFYGLVVGVDRDNRLYNLQSLVMFPSKDTFDKPGAWRFGGAHHIPRPVAERKGHGGYALERHIDVTPNGLVEPMVMETVLRKHPELSRYIRVRADEF